MQSLHLALSPILHFMIANVATSTSIMHAQPRCLLRLDLTASRSFEVIAGRLGGREARTAPPCKGYQRYTDPGAPTSCRVHARWRHSAENIQSDACAEITVSRRAVTIEVSHSVNHRMETEAGRGGEEFVFFTFIFINIPGSHTDNRCQCSTWSLVRLKLLPQGSATRSSAAEDSAVAVLLNVIPCFINLH